MGDFLGPKNPTMEIFISNLVSTCYGKKWAGQIEKCWQVYLGEKEGARLSAKHNTFIHDAENFGLVHLLERYSVKDATTEQKLVNCHAVHDIATHKKRRVCVTIKN